MKKKLVLTVILTISLLAVVAVAVYAMRFLSSDGTWGGVDDGPIADPGDTLPDGANCLTYADGPSSSFEDPNSQIYGINLSDSLVIQVEDLTNWNQVRYGAIKDGHSNYRNCTIASGWDEHRVFNKQSGLAFRGAIGPGENGSDIPPKTPFLLGKMCHINNPIQWHDSWGNLLEMTYVDLSVNGVRCSPGQTLVADKNGTPYEPPRDFINLDYTFTVKLDETSNTDDLSGCPYRTYDQDETPCADAIIPGQTQEGSTSHLYCQTDHNVLDYQIAILGFTTVPKGEACPSTPPSGPMPGIFISDEGETNCVCLWGMITDVVPAAVELNFFIANGENESVVLEWETAFETDNLGFNIYRSANGSFEDAEKLNPTLIESLVPTGSTYGADYQFVDATANPFVTYYYWLEDVDVNGETELHGPVFAEWID